MTNRTKLGIIGGLAVMGAATVTMLLTEPDPKMALEPGPQLVITGPWYTDLEGLAACASGPGVPVDPARVHGYESTGPYTLPSNATPCTTFDYDHDGDVDMDDFGVLQVEVTTRPEGGSATFQ